MLVVRPIKQTDAEAFIDIAYHANIGMTSMPHNRHLLMERLAESETAFAKEIQKPHHERYLFVIEDTDSKTIGGTCGIIAKEKHEIPIFYFRTENTSAKSHLPGLEPKPIPILRTVHYYDSPSELCSLFLTPKFRHSGAGRLLSLSRLLFIATFPQRFDKMLFASLRGHIDADNRCAFWEGIGRHFFDADLPTLLHMREDEEIDIASLLPEFPIYIELLPKDVQEAIGRVHEETIPALNMLIQEGFQQTEEVDPIDGGPIIEAEITQLRTVKYSVQVPINEITNNPIDGPRYLLSNVQIDFRACYGSIRLSKTGEATISKEIAMALDVNKGDFIRYVAPIGIYPH